MKASEDCIRAEEIGLQSGSKYNVERNGLWESVSLKGMWCGEVDLVRIGRGDYSTHRRSGDL